MEIDLCVTFQKRTKPVIYPKWSKISIEFTLATPLIDILVKCNLTL